MESAPATAFEVPESEFLLQFLLISLDDPAMLGQEHQFAQLHIFRHGRQPILAGISVLGLGILLPMSGSAQQCGVLSGPNTDTFLLRVHHLSRVGFNEVEALAGTQVIGPYEGNWTVYITSTETRNGGTIHSGSNSGQTLTGVQWNDPPPASALEPMPLLTPTASHQSVGMTIRPSVLIRSPSTNPR